MDDLDFEAAEPAPVAAPVELGDNPVDWGENDVIGTIDWETSQATPSIRLTLSKVRPLMIRS